MLHRPFYANFNVCPAKRAPENQSAGNPEDWFQSAGFRERGIHAASFDFFVDWQKKRVCDEVWIKRISDSDDIFAKTAEELRDAIAECDGRDDCNTLYQFFQYHNITQKYMLFRNFPQEYWEAGSERVIQLDLSQGKKGPACFLSVTDVQDQIARFRKTAVPIGRAGMKYAPSSLECFLSKKSFFWPGDCDMLLFDESKRVLAVVEFKKHTHWSRIPFADQKISNYVKRDLLKYKSLGLLRDKFQTKLFVLYYSVEPENDYILLEELTGPYYDLREAHIQRLDLPKKDDAASQARFAEAFLVFSGILPGK